MTQATIRTRIKTVLDTVTNKGKTHDYLRWAVKQSDFETLFSTTISTVVQIRGWEIAYRGFRQEEPHIGRTADQYRVHRFEIHGYLGLDDSTSTEKTFAALAESVCNALDADTTLNEESMSLYRNPTQLIIDERLFAGVLCHHGQIDLEVAETI